MILRIINERILSAEDFASRLSGAQQGSVILVPDAWAPFLAEYERAMTESRKASPAGMRAAISLQVESLAAALRTGREFRPFLEA